MAIMYDAAGGGIPADATEILIPTDGSYAAVGARLRQEFPSARFHTYSALGRVFAEWIDVETGCVWPPAAAVAIWRAWRNQGCKGFYGARSTRTSLQTLLTADELSIVEWFEADPTGLAHILPGDVATQYLWAPSYDASETTPAFEAPAGASPAPVTPAAAPVPPANPPSAQTSHEIGEPVHILTINNVATAPDGCAWVDFELPAGSGIAGAPYVVAASPGAKPGGGYDTARADITAGAAAGKVRVQITGGIPNLRPGYGLHLPVTP